MRQHFLTNRFLWYFSIYLILAVLTTVFGTIIVAERIQLAETNINEELASNILKHNGAQTLFESSLAFEKIFNRYEVNCAMANFHTRNILGVEDGCKTKSNFEIKKHFSSNGFDFTYFLGLTKHEQWFSILFLCIQSFLIATSLIFYRKLFQREKSYLNEIIRTQKSLNLLAAQVAHDIRSPLSAIDAITNSTANIPTEQKSVLNSATDRLRNISKDLLTKYKNPNALDSENNTQDVNLNEHLKSLIKEKRAEIANQSIHKIEFDELTESVTLNTNPVELSRVVSNLINNAFEATPDKPNCLRIKLTQKPQSIVLEISDDGPGIPLEIIKQIANNEVNSTKTNGTGLGLIHAKRFAEQNKGRLEIKKSKTGGALIHLEFQK